MPLHGRLWLPFDRLFVVILVSSDYADPGFLVELALAIFELTLSVEVG